MFPQAPFAPEARRALAQSLTPANIAQEVKYLNDAGRNSFERPYGLAWLLQLAAELKESDDPEARQWSAALRPLEQAVTARIVLVAAETGASDPRRRAQQHRVLPWA